MEAPHFFGTAVAFQWTTQFFIPENRTLLNLSLNPTLHKVVSFMI
jgi:hypothetical protein